MNKHLETSRQHPVKERPIIFSTGMVKAIIEGRKTQTRRVINLPSYHPSLKHKQSWTIKGWKVFDCNGDLEGTLKFPYGHPGDVLWVRETWAMFLDGFLPKSTNVIFKGVKWKPSIHMKKVYAQIWLEITSIGVERLQDISEEDAIAEGINEWPQPKLWDCYQCEKGHKGMANLCEDGSFSNPIDSFRSLWESINDKSTKNWTSNPWVWVISFKVLSTTGKPKTERGAGDDYPVIEAYHTAKKVCQ